MNIYIENQNSIIHETDVDFVLRPCAKEIHIVQYDKSLPVIKVNLFRNGEKYIIPDEAAINIRFGKLDRTFVMKPVLGCNEEKTAVYFEVDEQMTVLAGKVSPVLEMIIEFNIAYSSPIAFVIDKNPVQMSDVESATVVYPIIYELIGTVAQYESRIGSLESKVPSWDAKSNANNLENGTGENSLQQHSSSKYEDDLEFENPNYTPSTTPSAGAKGQDSSEFGGNSEVTGVLGAAFGRGNIVVGQRGFATGTKNATTGANAFVNGLQNYASGDHSHAEGTRNVAGGLGSHAEGSETKALGPASHTEGQATVSKDNYIITDVGVSPTPTPPSPGPRPTPEQEDAQNGHSVHAEGHYTLGLGMGSHSEGFYTNAYARFSHAEGYNTQTGALVLRKTENNKNYYSVDASIQYMHAEGIRTKAIAQGSHAEGLETTANGNHSHAEGYATITTGQYSHAEGRGTTASNSHSHAEGYITTASGWNAHSEGQNTIASGACSHAEGQDTTASGWLSHTWGIGTKATHDVQTSIGKYNKDISGTLFEVGNGASNSSRSNAFEVYTDGHAEVGLMGSTNLSVATKQYVDTNSSSATNIQNGTGVNSVQQKQSDKDIEFENPNYTPSYTYEVGAFGKDSAMFNGNSMAKGELSTAIGRNTLAEGARSFASGTKTAATGNNAHAEGLQTLASGANGAHAEGNATVSSGSSSHAEGNNTKAQGGASHAEGTSTIAYGDYSHAGGRSSEARGESSFAHGQGIYVNQLCQVGFGKFNRVDSNTLFVIGNGTSASARLNAFEVYQDGKVSAGNKFQEIMPDATVNFIGRNPNAEAIDASLSATINTGASGNQSSAFGKNTMALATASFANGNKTIAKGEESHAEGYQSVTLGDGSHAEGAQTVAAGLQSHSEGSLTQALGDESHAEGHDTIAGALASHSEGAGTKVGNYSQESGIGADHTVSPTPGPSPTPPIYIAQPGEGSHVEGYNNIVSGYGSHAEGVRNYVTGNYSHAEGINNSLLKDYAHVSGYNNISNADCSETFGIWNTNNGYGSFVAGFYNECSYNHQTIVGKYNDNKSNTLFEVGNGDAENTRSNAFEVYRDGTLGIINFDANGNKIGYKRIKCINGVLTIIN